VQVVRRHSKADENRQNYRYESERAEYEGVREGTTIAESPCENIEYHRQYCGDDVQHDVARQRQMLRACNTGGDHAEEHLQADYPDHYATS